MQDSGTMPLIAELILAVSVGCVEIQPAANQGSPPEQEDMDSYQVSDPLSFSSDPQSGL